MLQSFEGNIKAMESVKTTEQYVNEVTVKADEMSERVQNALDYVDLILTDNAISDAEKKGFLMVKRYLEGAT